MNKETIYFKNCLGIFQGGGCKALSYVGAYRECVSRGVFFSKLAGTSAGSIIAALISAGASPEYMENLIKTTDFNIFKSSINTELKNKEYRVSRWLLKLPSLINKKLNLISKFLEHFGLFSSSEIEVWIETSLRTLLNKPEGEIVKFKDLNIPLTIVATELGSQEPKIWSTESTPEDSVAYAVRCSCNLPIFFQPVDQKFVDGGIVSNLPSFVLNNGHSRNFEKLLCFTFKPDERTKSNSSLTTESYFNKLISAIIDGSVHIQNELQPNLHIIEINDLPLGTVDFDLINEKKLNEMFEIGRKTTERFFNSEVTNIKNIINNRLLLHTEPEALNQIVREYPNIDDHIIFSLNDTRFVYNIFPTLLKWRLQGVRISFLTKHVNQSASNAHDEEHEKFRRLVLKALGVSLVEINSLLFEGVLFGSDINVGNALVLHYLRKHDNPLCFAVKYDKHIDINVITTLRDSIKSIVTNIFPVSSITVKRGGVDKLFSRLKTIEHYAHDKVKMSIENVDVNNIVFLTKFVKSYKYNQIKSLIDFFEKQDVELFESAELTFELDGKKVEMPITPPVSEKHGDKYYVFEGNSRITYLIKEKKVQEIKLIVVQNVDAPLPSKKSFNYNQILVSDEDKKGDQRYEGFNRSLYRIIEEAVRKPILYRGFFDNE
jgi:predicted acylesterase/phospholipase RssA